MIRAFVDFALKNRWMVIGGLVVLTAWGIVSFRNLPIEAYPGCGQQLCSDHYPVAGPQR
jgi:Cu/Ag efflux pump CusA